MMLLEICRPTAVKVCGNVKVMSDVEGMVLAVGESLPAGRTGV